MVGENVSYCFLFVRNCSKKGLGMIYKDVDFDFIIMEKTQIKVCS